MKRFFCTVCQKLRRQRHLPDVLSVVDPPRVGQCDVHNRPELHTPRKVWMKRVRKVAGLGSTRKTKASKAKSLSKKKKGSA